MRAKMILSKFESSQESLPMWKTILTWICRLVVGVVFVFSGMAKAIDPWGTLYKIQDYLQAMDIAWISSELVITGAFILFSVEFLIGIFLLLGSFRRMSPVICLLFMVVMLPLTLWIAIKNPVPDCGCFGDALTISNWETFFKNVVITAMGIWLLIYNRRVHWLVTPALQWLLFVASAFIIICTGVIGYRVQPLIDFRAYKVGESLIDTDGSDSEPHFVFIYEKDGKQQQFGETDELPDEADGWKFVERKELPVNQGEVKEKNTEKALRLWAPEDEEDVTDEVVGKDDVKQLVLMIPSLSDVSIASTWKINSLQEWANKHDIDFYAVAAGTPQQVADWKDVSMADYPLYLAEDTSIKEVVRGNPAVVYLDGGKIVWKSTLSALRGDDFMNSEMANSAQTLYPDLSQIVKTVGVCYICIVAVLIMLSFLPKMFGYRAFFSTKRRLEVSDDDKVHPEELSSHDKLVQ